VDTVSGIAGSNTVIVTGGDGPDIPLGPGRGSQPSPSALPVDRKALDGVFAFLHNQRREDRVSGSPVAAAALTHRGTTDRWVDTITPDDLDWAMIG
jgi:hypothetical protein